MNKKLVLGLVICNALISIAIGGFVFSMLSKKPSKEKLIAEFYAIENAVHVSPHGLRKSMDDGKLQYTVVDLRSKQEYEKEHVIGSINIPAYSDPDTSAYGDVDRIVNEFKKLPKDKDIVVYCYSAPCMTGRKIGEVLTENGIFVKHLGIGWNEWRYHWNSWNHEHEWSQTIVDDYIGKGSDPGKPMRKERNPLTPCTLDDAFGC